MANKPIIRFNEYSDEWEEITLSEIAEIVDRKTDEQSNAPVMMISAASGFINQSEKYSTDNAGSSLKNYILLKKGELAYNHGYSALRNFGSCFTLEKEEARIPFVYHCFSIPSQNPYFYGYYLNCGIFDKQLRKLVASTARMDGLLNISYSDYTSIKVKKPSEDEQKELATFFKNINNLIISTQEKLDKAIILKKSMLEKMFPQNDAKIPELRFKGFSGEWKEKCLGECFSERDERSADGELISVTINQGVVRAKDLDRLDSSSNDKSNYKIVCKGDLAYNTMRMWQGAEGYSPYDGILSPAYTVCIPSKNVHTQFFAYMFKKNHIIHQFKINSQGLTSDTWNLKFNNFSLIKVRVPNIDEQKTIANYFENIDKLITSYNDELEKLKTIKKSLLEKMFV